MTTVVCSTQQGNCISKRNNHFLRFLDSYLTSLSKASSNNSDIPNMLHITEIHIFYTFHDVISCHVTFGALFLLCTHARATHITNSYTTAHQIVSDDTEVPYVHAEQKSILSDRMRQRKKSKQFHAYFSVFKKFPILIRQNL